ncbi:hypothetical protein RvY_10135 [Ramazzottius varieornatus]|uniref:BTB domain-containing protein n=1 Tax=Ramazzottius varieornatus TaxID=947166 RepID=A0A1D1VBS0_RAMVA|nr:hypothetical protein RvY_10135 [Ramazzottius varieornatus]
MVSVHPTVNTFTVGASTSNLQELLEEDTCSSCGSFFIKNPRVRINVSGQIFEISQNTINLFPTSLLGDPHQRIHHYDSHRHEYFFERNPDAFNAIFNYFINGGQLRRPEGVTIDVFLAEIEFFNLGEDATKAWFRNEQVFLHQRIAPKNELQRKIWLLLENDTSSVTARLISVVSVFVAILSVAATCAETIPGVYNSYNIFRRYNLVELPAFKVAASNPFFQIEAFCTVYFTVELVTRFIVSPIKKKFFLQMRNIIDLLAVVPFYVELIYIASYQHEKFAPAAAVLSELRVVRLLRMRMTHHFRGVRILLKTVVNSLWEIGLLLILLMICVVFFAAAIYYAELSRTDTLFQSIPGAFYWAFITLTTVGYGDFTPKGPWGMFVACLCAAVGSVVLPLSIPAVARNYDLVYQRARNEDRIRTLIIHPERAQEKKDDYMHRGGLMRVQTWIGKLNGRSTFTV